MKKEERIYRQHEVSEKALERTLTTRVRRLGCLAVKMNDVMCGGLPDRLIVLPGGKVMWVEMKSRGARPTPLQQSRIRELRSYGHIVFVIDSPELVDEFIRLIESELA